MILQPRSFVVSFHSSGTFPVRIRFGESGNELLRRPLSLYRSTARRGIVSSHHE